MVERWSIDGKSALKQYAPYAAHVMEVELFFQFALASHRIGTERPSNRVDIAYLYYLPVCMAFVSSDDLHRRCIPLFLRPEQRFVWGPDLKDDLKQINAHFMAFPESQKERGIRAFAHAPPKRDGSIVRKLRAEFMGAEYDDRPPITPAPPGDPRDEELVRFVNQMTEAPDAPEGMTEEDSEEPPSFTFKRLVRKKRGSGRLS